MQQRQIKFRAWDKDGKLLSNAITFSTTPQGYIWPEVPHVGMEAYEQFTGLLDKNGKEIYEGDVLEDGKKQKGVVFWHNASFRIEWQMRSYDGSRPTEAMVDDCFGYGPVIGNIHENPDLIDSGENKAAA